jgi:copper chaperone CopZ
MIRNALIALLALTLVGSPSLASQPPDTIYEVVLSGITCKGCKREVSDILTKIENVKAVDVDVKAEKATITMKGAVTLDRATVEKALKGTKFALVSMTEKKAAESKPNG